ncbi:MAG: hypothetical protein AAGF93_25030 [Cyanobacteria bacterium P01_H01_bin.105]
MNYMFFTHKQFFRAAIFTFSLLCVSCHQIAKQGVEDYQLIKQNIIRPKAQLISFRATTDTTLSPESKDQKRNQELYQNEALGIGFEKSEGVEIQAADSALSIWTAADYERIEDFVEATPLLISIEANPDNLTAQEWLSTRSYLLNGAVEEQAVGNQAGIRFDWSGMWAYTSVAVPHPTRQYMILITWDNEMLDYEMLFEAIVSSLVFI